MRVLLELGQIGVHGLPPGALKPHIWMALAVTVVFAGIARLVRGVTTSGAIAGAIICFLLYFGAGLGAFLALVTVFALTWITTRLGYRKKQAFGTAERGDGRQASQVLANLAVAGGSSAMFIVTGAPVFLLTMAAALSEAAADTVSSELGQARSDSAWLITSWKQVPAGTDGGITWDGTLAGIASAITVSLVCAITGLLSWKWFVLSVAGATVGMIVDSFLGAWLEQRRRLDNDTVNFLGTLTAALVACVFSR